MRTYCYVVDRVTEPCKVFYDELECYKYCKLVGYTKYTINYKENGDVQWKLGGVVNVQ